MNSALGTWSAGQSADQVIVGISSLSLAIIQRRQSGETEEVEQAKDLDPEKEIPKVSMSVRMGSGWEIDTNL